MKLKAFNILFFICLFFHYNGFCGISSNTFSDTIELDQINIRETKQKLFDFNFIRGIFNNQIYSGKKNELIILKNKSSKALNNPRITFNQTVSLNITQTDDAGLQLNIGGRGLDPKRTSNFNVRQNYYDISADPLGYPESYYVPPTESLSSIELIRGAASLQYGTQFGGFINFNINKPNPNKKIEFISRNTFASNKLYSNFSSFSGTVNKLSYYLFLNIKNGKGFRPNSDFDSQTYYSHISYEFSNQIKFSYELTKMQYLSQQPGGLTDLMFNENIFQSNRERNWFEVDWFLNNFKFNYKISKKTNLLINFFSLNAERSSIGFRSNRVSQIDSDQERDLLLSEFNNFGIETKLTHKYLFFSKKSNMLVGNKIFFGETNNIQGPGSDLSDPDFDFYLDDYPNYEFQSNYNNPNYNSAFFIENEIELNPKIRLIPGLRYEFIRTESEGFFKEINLDNAGNVILNETIESSNSRTRSFFLFGVGTSYNILHSLELYGNISQNYRAVTFADINTVNPSFVINPEIGDEDGYNIDIGVRGLYKRYIKYDFSVFRMFYNNRIGFIQRKYDDNSVKNEKGNVGDAEISGIESLLNISLSNMLSISKLHNINLFFNHSILISEYVRSKENGILSNEVEFVPKINFKSGLNYNYNKLSLNFQYSYLSSQYTDATNSVESDLSGLIGLIPSYSILDISLSYSYNNIMLEAGCNNVLDKYYFTTRATGYPGPGIIPSINRNFYVTLEFKL